MSLNIFVIAVALNLFVIVNQAQAKSELRSGVVCQTGGIVEIANARLNAQINQPQIPIYMENVGTPAYFILNAPYTVSAPSVTFIPKSPTNEGSSFLVCVVVSGSTEN